MWMSVYDKIGNKLSTIYKVNGTEADAVFDVNGEMIYGRFIVQFIDWDGTVLLSEKLVSGTVPTAPSPVRDGYIFPGWEPEVVPVDGDAVYTAVYKTSQATAVYRFPICSDLHVNQTTTHKNNVNVANAIEGYSAGKSSGDFDAVVCLGDLPYATQGITNTSLCSEAQTLAAKLKDLGVYIITGNHDVGCNGGVIDSDYANWKALTGCDGNYTIDIPNTDFLMIFMSMYKFGQGITPIYPEATRTWIRGLLAQAKQDGKRVILFTHYCYPVADVHFGYRAGYGHSTVSSMTYVEGTDLDTLVEQWYGTSTGGSATGVHYETPGGDADLLYKDIATYDNVLWFTGHVHTPWRWQDGIPNIKAYTIPGGASMINLPSLGFENQDALVELMSDGRVVVKAREGSIELGGSYVYTWDGVRLRFGT